MDTRRLLVPLDGSRLAESVLPAVTRIASACAGSVTLMHIREERPPATIHGEAHLSDQAEAEAYLDGIASRLRESGVHVDCHVHETLEGDVARSIVLHADEFEPDLVVLCTHGHGGVRDVLFGSIAQQVLQRGTWPVLVIEPGPGGEAEPFEPKRVLVPLDGSEQHAAPLDQATKLACALDAELLLVIVVPTRATLVGDRSAPRRTMPATMTAILELAEENAVAYLRKAADGCVRAGARVRAQVRRGDPVDEVMRYADETNADLLVLSSHGKVGLDAIFSASFGARIIARARTPLLLVRS